MTLTCLSIILTKPLGGVFQTMALEVSFLHVITNHLRGILVGEIQQPKFSNVVSISLLYLGMLSSIAKINLCAND